MTGLRRNSSFWATLFPAATIVPPLVAFGIYASGATAAPLGLIFEDAVVRALVFTLWQAGLSAVLSLCVAIPTVLALRVGGAFAGRTLVLALFALPIALPQLLAVLGVLGVFGNAGWFAALAQMLGFDWPSIYGLSGILIAHVFFNAPLLVLIGLSALGATLSVEQERLAGQLGMTLWQRWRLIEWPGVRGAMLAGTVLVFLLCTASFTVVLTIGGGPRATTLEVAIYQALVFEFEPQRAVILATLQMVIGLTVIALFSAPLRAVPAGSSLLRLGRSHGGLGRSPGVAGQLGSMLVIALVAGFVLLPVANLVVSGLGADLARLAREPAVLRAISTSALVGVSAAVISVACAYGLIYGATLSRTNLAQWSLAVLVLPPMLLATGWFLLLRIFTSPFAHGVWVIIAINAVMALPFATGVLSRAVTVARERHDRIAAQLGLRGWTRFRIVTLPVLAPAFGLAFAFCLAVSLGDFGVVALFGSQDVQTLPHLIYQRMGSYRTDDAQGLAFVLMVLVLACMAAIAMLARRMER